MKEEHYGQHMDDHGEAYCADCEKFEEKETGGKIKCENCKTERTTGFPISEETGDRYCPDCNWTFDK